jgi:hypothetical protein
MNTPASRKPTRSECFQMSGRLAGIVSVLSSDLKKPVPCELQSIQDSSRLDVIQKVVKDACAMLEALAPPYNKKGE